MYNLQPVRGTKDLFGDEVLMFEHVISVAKKISNSYNFLQLQTPIFEFSEVFERNLGEASDIISKEVYKFLDRSQNWLTLRPEFTAGIVRALVSNGELLQILPRKFFSYGQVFRYDRPQKGRQRQFHQVNFEIFGEDSLLCDVEAMLLANEFLSELGLGHQLSLEINSLGCAETKKVYEAALTSYFQDLKSELSADSLVRLEKNPLRILDSKEVEDIALIELAPKITDFFTDEAKSRFDEILNLLEKFCVKFRVNPRLVRGLDYYTSTVFEFISNHEGAQNAVLAGGRYDNLVEKMSGKKAAAFGFAAGIERLMLLAKNPLKKFNKIAVNYVSNSEKLVAFEIAQDLRRVGLIVEFIHDANFKKQMKKASQNEINFVVIIGENEVLNQEAVVKNFNSGSEQKIAFDKIAEFFMSNLI